MVSERKRRARGRRFRTARIAAAGASVLLFAFFCCVAVDRARRAAELDGVVGVRTAPTAPGVPWRDEKNREETQFVPFDSPRAQAAADRAVVEFWRTAERRADSPESRAVRFAHILEARRRFATSDVAAERRLRRTADARSAARAADALRGWAFDDERFDSIGFADFDGEACFDAGGGLETADFLADADGSDVGVDPDLAAATAFLAELSAEPAATSVPTAALSDLDARGDFRDAVVFLDANEFVPVAPSVETVVVDAAPRTLVAAGALQAFVALFGAGGSRFFAVDWARFFAGWERSRRGFVSFVWPSPPSFSFREPIGSSGVLAELAVVRLLN